METNAFDRIRIQEFLRSQGHMPVRDLKEMLIYRSPLRKDNQACLCVDPETNRWFDAVQKMGGTASDMLKQYFKTEDTDKISGCLACLAPGLLGRQPEVKPPIVAEFIFPNLAGGRLVPVYERGILSSYLIERYLKGVTFRKACEENSRFGIGFRNDSGGLEIQARDSLEHIGPDDITLTEGQGGTCIVFGTFFDFLAFRTMAQEKYPEYKDAPCLILNSTALVRKAASVLDGYDTAVGMLGNDLPGRLVTSALKEQMGEKLTDRAMDYRNYRTLNEYMLNRMTCAEEDPVRIRSRIKML